MIILGFPWLQEQNPIINWRTGEFHWQTGVPDIKKIRRLTEQRWKNEQETKELNGILTTGTRNLGRALRQKIENDDKKELKEIPRERTLRQWKREREAKELKEIPVQEITNEHQERNEILMEKTKDSRRVLKRRRNETNQQMNRTTYVSTIVEKCRAELQRRKEEAARIPNDIGNINKPKLTPKSEYRSAFIEEVDDEEEFKTHTLNPLDKDDLSILIGLMDSMEPEEVWINARTNVATELAAEENKKKEGIPIEKLVPEEYHEYLDVFDEEKANRFPEERSWDHKIEMKEGFEPKIVQKLQLNTGRTN